MANNLYLLVACVALGAAVAYRYPDLPPGPYCASGGSQQCCSSRQDACSHRILDTLCYCDEFCNRTTSHDDCCPDYEEVCLGIRPPPVPEPVGLGCQLKGKTYYPPDKVMDDCNTCKCVQVSAGVAKWECESDLCLMSSDVIGGVNSYPQAGWRAANYTEFHGKKLKDALVYKLGTLPLSAETKRMGPIRHDKDINYPNNFDAREAWPGRVSPVVDQGWCGSDWAVVIATVTSDRFAIQSRGAESPILAPQSLLSCNRRMQRGCDGGHIDVAWNFAKNHGLVGEECYPYEASVQPCKLRRKGTLRDAGCAPQVPQRTSRYKVGPPGRLQKEKDIMYDIMQSGPVHAIMTVYQDFFHYRDGVYSPSTYGNKDLKGYHSVRIVGWGGADHDPNKYWIVANSWGTWWGENGYFRVKRGHATDIESFVVTVLSDVTESFRRK